MPELPGSSAALASNSDIWQRWSSPPFPLRPTATQWSMLSIRSRPSRAVYHSVAFLRSETITAMLDTWVFGSEIRRGLAVFLGRALLLFVGMDRPQAAGDDAPASSPRWGGETVPGHDRA